MLKDLDVESSEGEWPISLGTKTTYNGYYNTSYVINSSTAIDANTSDLTATFTFKYSTPNYTPSASTLYTSTFCNGERNFSGIALQLVGYNSSSQAVAGSDVILLTSNVNGDYLKLSETAFQPAFSSCNTITRLANFHRESAGIYVWPEEISLHMDTSSVQVTSVKLFITLVANLTTVETYNGGTAQTYGSRRARLYTSTSIQTISLGSNTFSGYPEIASLRGTKMVEASSGVHSGAKITKKDLLSIEGTPCDYFLSFCKLFHLYIEKDKLTNTIYVRDSDSFFLGHNVVNIQDKIDRTKQFKITPLSFDTKWYDLKYPSGDQSEFQEEYQAKYGVEYGKQTINTGYNFNSESTDMLKGILFKNGVDALEKSRYYQYRILDFYDNVCPNFLFTPATYTLFNSGFETFDVTLTSPSVAINGGYNGNDDYYDAYPKTQLHSAGNKAIDGSGILVFFEGFVDLYGIGQAGVHMPLNYYLTDDLQEMVTLNGGPCWLFTNSEFNTSNVRIAYKYTRLPVFRRMSISLSNGYIGRTWDIGPSKELYVPGVRYGDVSTIYSLAWDSVISDMFNVNTRVVECYVNLSPNDMQNCLRKIYWFDNCW